MPRSVDEVLEIADFAASVRIDLAVVGPELPLALGIADELEMRGVPVFGPRQAAAEIEGSKVFAKEFMARRVGADDIYSTRGMKLPRSVYLLE